MVQMLRTLSFFSTVLLFAGWAQAAPLTAYMEQGRQAEQSKLIKLAQYAPVRLENRLREQGYRRIELIRRTANAFVVRACLDGGRYRLRARRNGRILSSTRIGRCGQMRPPADIRDRDGLRPRQVRRVLQRRGFNRIRFIDRELPIYVVRACRNGRRLELRLNRFARVRERTRIGRCDDNGDRDSGYNRKEIREILQRRGYTDIDFFDRTGPRYGVTACRRAQKFRMRINRHAEIKQRRRTGWCRPAARPMPRPAPQSEQDYSNDYDDREIDEVGQIDPETCQRYLDALVRRDRIHFGVDSSRLRQRSYPLLRRLARVMKRCPSSEIEISGHTDSDGSREYNQRLSEQRVISVARFLKDEGISTRRMSARGYGEDRPLVQYEESDRDKALNRRIEFTVQWGDE